MSINDNPKNKLFNETVRTKLLTLLKESFGDNLSSVIVYGSVLSKEFVPRVSDINLLIILESADFNQILAFGSRAHRIIQRNRITPLILTRSEFINSADVFPMEYHDIQEKNSVLYGSDVTKHLTFTKKNLRHQLESLLRGQVTRIRQLLIASRGNRRIIQRFLLSWSGTLVSIFRGLLRLTETSPPSGSPEELVEMACATFQVDTRPFLDLLQLRTQQKKADVQWLALHLHEELMKLTGIIDKYDFKEKAKQ